MEMLAYKECDSKETVMRRKGIYGKFTHKNIQKNTEKQKNEVQMAEYPLFDLKIDNVYGYNNTYMRDNIRSDKKGRLIYSTGN